MRYGIPAKPHIELHTRTFALQHALPFHVIFVQRTKIALILIEKHPNIQLNMGSKIKL